MPIYEYQCNKCDAVFETILTSVEDNTAASCPECDSNNVRKKISAGSYRLSSSSGGTIPKGALSGCSSSSGFS